MASRPWASARSTSPVRTTAASSPSWPSAPPDQGVRPAAGSSPASAKGGTTTADSSGYVERANAGGSARPPPAPALDRPSCGGRAGRGAVRRAKLYYLRGRRGKSARIFERTDSRAKALNAAFKGFKRPKGEAEDLTQIKGISAELAARLNQIGVIKYEQIANFSGDDIVNVDDMLNLKGAIEKNDWLAQARALLTAAPDADADKK